MQKLCVHLGGKGKSINDDIKKIVAQGVSTHLQKALDIIRVIGNELVHPRQININDNRNSALLLFKFINYIVETKIAVPAEVDSLYELLPKSKREQIETRDKKPK